VKHANLGRYELLRKIASGGMAEIFLARQSGEGRFFRDVVIKRLFPHYAENEQTLRMFQDEAQLSAELSHPNIPQVYDLGYADGYWYLAMEHVSGETLADLCRSAAKLQRPMPLAVALGIVSQVCMALHHAHERRDREGRLLSIVHRDVTPQNIVVSQDGVVKILDFGVAQSTARAESEASAVRGTVAYMAPEQVLGKPLDRRADVFALGVIVYELTTGENLYHGSDVQIMTATVEQDVVPPSQRVAQYPTLLERSVLKALSRDRSARTESAAQLAIELDQFCVRHGLSSSVLVVSEYVRSIRPDERAHDDSDDRGTGIVHTVSLSMPPRSLQELEAKLLADELHALGQPVQAAAASSADRLRLDELDDGVDVRPVVLLSNKRPTLAAPEPSAFVNELGRRLLEEPKNTNVIKVSDVATRLDVAHVVSPMDGEDHLK